MLAELNLTWWWANLPGAASIARRKQIKVLWHQRHLPGDLTVVPLLDQTGKEQGDARSHSSAILVTVFSVNIPVG